MPLIGLLVSFQMCRIQPARLRVRHAEKRGFPATLQRLNRVRAAIAVRRPHLHRLQYPHRLHDVVPFKKLSRMQKEYNNNDGAMSMRPACLTDAWRKTYNGRQRGEHRMPVMVEGRYEGAAGTADRIRAAKEASVAGH